MLKQLSAFVCLFFIFSIDVFAVGTFIPAASRVDVAHDFKRNIIYISQGNSVLRYQVGSGSFLPPFVLGGNLMGMDISLDGSTLAVADATNDSLNVWIHLVNLDSGASTKVLIPRAFMEGGTFTVAYGSDGALLISSTFEGSGWVPLRRYDPSTAMTTVLAGSIRQNTMLVSTGDSSAIGFVESNISDGAFGRYRVSDANLLRKSGYTDGTSWFNFEMGANNDGTQYAIPTYGGTFFYDVNLVKIGTIGQYAGALPIGVAYHPVEKLAYFPWSNTSEVRVYDVSTFSQINAYNFEDNFSWVGNWAFVQGRTKLSLDGSLLVVTVTGGVRYLIQYAPLNASEVFASTIEGSPVAVTLAGTIGNGGMLGYSISQPPTSGSLSGTAPNLVYTPNTGFSGTDSFRYRVSYGRGWVEANGTIVVTAANHPPVANPDFAKTRPGHAVTIPVLANDSDVDGDILTITSVSSPARGQARIVGSSVVYTANKKAKGSDEFNYSISDGQGGNATSVVTVRIRRD